MDGELVRLTGTEWAVLDYLWEASPQTMTQLAHTLAGREGWAKGTTTTVLKRRGCSPASRGSGPSGTPRRWSAGPRW